MRLVRGLVRLHHGLHLLRRRLVQEGEEGVPAAAHVVEYKEKETRTKALVGKVAIEFSPDARITAPGTAGSGGCSLSHALSPPQQPEAAEE